MLNLNQPAVRILGLLVICLGLIGCKQESKPSSNPAATTETTGGVVKVTLDFDNRRPTEQLEVPFVAEMTAFDALLALKSEGIDSVTHDFGEKAFVESIGGIKNDEPGETAKKLDFYVNGKQGTRSSGVYTLKPGDAIIWRFERFE